MRKITKRAAVIATAAVVAVGGGTAAFAYAAGWFSGDATVVATTSAIGNVHASITVANNAANHLYPGRQVPITAATLYNPNDYTVLIKTVGTITALNGPSGCGATQAHLVFSDLPASTTVAPHTTLTNIPLGNVTMAQDADPVCAGGTLTLTASLTGEISS